MPIHKEIIYPFFLECCSYTEDLFWKSIFEDLAYGKTPSGTYISRNFLVCNYKNKKFSYKIERKEPKVLYDEIYRLFTSNIGVLSRKQKIQKKIEFYNTEKTIKEGRSIWDNIRKKNVKDILYEKFVLEMMEKYSLSIKQGKYLLSLITVGIMFKMITSKDIQYEGEKIKSIAGISFEKGKIKLARTLYSKSSTSSKEIEEDDKEEGRMSDEWEKYLIGLGKI